VNFTLTDHKGWVNSLEALSNGNLASSSDNGTIKIWNTTSGNPSNTLDYDCGVYSIIKTTVNSLASGGVYSGCSGWRAVKIWNTISGNQVMSFEYGSQARSLLLISRFKIKTILQVDPVIKQLLYGKKPILNKSEH
jgi:WD40 repeat protein